MAALSSKIIKATGVTSLLCAIIVLSGTGYSSAQDIATSGESAGAPIAPAPAYELYHSPPELRTTASPLTLEVTTSPLKKGSYRLEAFITRDGQSFPATFDSIGKNNIGRNAYLFTLAAPQKIIRYKFFLRDGNNKTLAESEEFTIARDCETDFNPTFMKPVDEREQVEQLATKSLLLEAQLEQLHTIYRLAEELQEEVRAKK